MAAREEVESPPLEVLKSQVGGTEECGATMSLGGQTDGWPWDSEGLFQPRWFYDSTNPAL